MGKLLKAIIVVLAINILIGGLATEYVLEFWAPYLLQYPVDIPFWQCAIAGIIVGEITIPASILTWIISFAL